ncbi:MAG: hypothetical protein MZU97_18280 [Bacillus subtilis]|nr:hypothetical protein [Bacillus subtilis]
MVVSTATRVVTVLDPQLVFPTGFYNWKFADTELRHTFMAAAEKYLMNNLYGGVPLFANGSFALYRLPPPTAPSTNYVAVMGYGTAFATMSADDSTVLMDDGQPGQAGKYTYRSAITGNPQTFNQWLYNDSVTAEVMGIYLDALYVYHFNAAKTGYEVDSVRWLRAIPSQSTARFYRSWQRSLQSLANSRLRDDLEWTYHAETNISGLPAGHEVINATDFVETFKLALQEEVVPRHLRRRRLLQQESTGIVNACAFRDEIADLGRCWYQENR